MTVSELIEYLRSLPLEVRGYIVWRNNEMGIPDPLDQDEIYVDNPGKRVWI